MMHRGSDGDFLALPIGYQPASVDTSPMTDRGSDGDFGDNREAQMAVSSSHKPRFDSDDDWPQGGLLHFDGDGDQSQTGDYSTESRAADLDGAF